MKDHYKILGCPKDATDDEIKRAYRKASLQAHPDKPGGSEERCVRSSFLATAAFLTQRTGSKSLATHTRSSAIRGEGRRSIEAKMRTSDLRCPTLAVSAAELDSTVRGALLSSHSSAKELMRRTAFFSFGGGGGGHSHSFGDDGFDPFGGRGGGGFHSCVALSLCSIILSQHLLRTGILSAALSRSSLSAAAPSASSLVQCLHCIYPLLHPGLHNERTHEGPGAADKPVIATPRNAQAACAVVGTGPLHKREKRNAPSARPG